MIETRAGVKGGGAIVPLSTGPKAPRCDYFNFFARKTAILTKNDTFVHANEGGSAPREGGPALGPGGPRAVIILTFLREKQPF